MIDDTPVTEEGLEGELEILREEVSRVEAVLEEKKREWQAARQAEHEAGERHRALKAISDPMLRATRQPDPPGVIQAAIFSPQDSFAKASYPAVAAAVGQTDAAFKEVIAAGIKQDKLDREVTKIEGQELPRARIAAHDKEQELEAFRAQQARALAMREVTLKDRLDKFRARLRGGKA